MNKDRFQEAVRNRSSEIVRQKIKKFKKDIGEAFRALTGDVCVESDATGVHRKANWQILLGIVESGDLLKTRSNWPTFLWSEQEEKVTKELFALMDPMQKALLAPEPSDDDDKPSVEESAE